MKSNDEHFTKSSPKHKVKLLNYLQTKGYARSNKNAKKLIRDNRVIVNGCCANSCSLMVDDRVDGQVVVITSYDGLDQAVVKSGSTLRLLEPMETQNIMEQKQIVPVSLNSNDNTNQICIVYNKPCGMICTTANDQIESMQALTLIDAQIPKGYNPVGRLDKHSHGLLLFSTDGRLISALLSPRTCIPRVYEIVVRGDVGREGEGVNVEIMKKVENGVQTDYGFFQGKVLDMERDVRRRGYAHEKCKVDCGAKRNDKYGMSPEEFVKLKTNISSEDFWPRDNNEVVSLIRVAVNEGKKRMVRRLFAALDLFVLGKCTFDLTNSNSVLLV